MLHQGAVGAVKNGIVLGMLQQHTHDRGLGNKGVDLLLYPQIALRFQYCFGKAGAVVVVGRDQTLVLYLFRQMDRRPCRQIAALGMSTDPQRLSGHFLRHLQRIFRGAQLRRNSGKEAHVEILLPAHQRGVRAAVGNKHAVIRQQKGHSGKLHHLFLIVVALKGEHFYITKSLGYRHSAHEGNIVLRGKSQLLIFLCQHGAHFAHGHGIHRLKTAKLCEASKINIRNNAQQQIVHFVESILRHAQITAPLQIVPNGGFGILFRHCFPLQSFFAILAHRCAQNKAYSVNKICSRSAPCAGVLRLKCVFYRGSAMTMGISTGTASDKITPVTKE